METRKHQASAIGNNGRTVYRWYVYGTDGHRYVTWEETSEAARAKAIRGTTLMIAARVDPAPPLIEDEPEFSFGPLTPAPEYGVPPANVS